jgi:hypothetical protein
MTLEEFESDDRFAVVTDGDYGCNGPDAVSWLLDPENSTAFCAVLNPKNGMVATLDEYDNVQWEPLDEFVG